MSRKLMGRFHEAICLVDIFFCDWFQIMIEMISQIIWGMENHKSQCFWDSYEKMLTEVKDSYR